MPENGDNGVEEEPESADDNGGDENEKSDVEEDEGVGEETEEVCVGSIVWAPWFGHYSPAEVVPLLSVPADKRKRLQTSRPDYVVIRFLGIEPERFQAAWVRKLKILGQTPEDLALSQKYPERYLTAIATIKYN